MRAIDGGPGAADGEAAAAVREGRRRVRRPWSRTSRPWPTSLCSRATVRPVTRSSRRSPARASSPTLVEVPLRPSAARARARPACGGVLAGGLFGGLLADPWHLPLDARRVPRGRQRTRLRRRSCCSAPTTARSTPPPTRWRSSRPRAPVSAASASTRPPACATYSARSAREADHGRRPRPHGGLDAEGARPRRLRAGRRRRPDGRVAAARVPGRGRRPPRLTLSSVCRPRPTAPSHPQPPGDRHEARPRLDRLPGLRPVPGGRTRPRRPRRLGLRRPARRRQRARAASTTTRTRP